MKPRYPAHSRSVRWDLRAACRGTDTSLFFPGERDLEASRDAKAICATCEVRDECLEEAIVNREHGIWGGTTERDRRRIRAQRRMQAGGREEQTRVTPPSGGS